MKNTKRLWGLIAILVVAVAVLGSILLFSNTHSLKRNEETIQDPKQKTDPERIVAKIGKRTITYKELLQNLEEKYGRSQLMQMVNELVVEKEAAELELSVSNMEKQAELDRMISGYESEDEFYESMRKQLGLSKEDIMKDIRYRLLLEKVATYKVQVTDAEIEAYLVEHSEIHEDLGQLHIRQIIVASEEHANLILSDLDNGADFALLAMEASLDEMTALDGGDLGWVGFDDPFVDPFIMDEAKQMEAGEIRGPIPVNEGYAVIWLEDRKDMPSDELKKYRESIRKELALGKVPALHLIEKRLREKWDAVILDESLK